MRGRIAFGTTLLLALARPAPGDPPTLSQALAADATLRAVEPIDSQRAWAVGDRGVLLRTDNGGRAWRRFEAPSDAPLFDVTFLDADRGWAVGGSTRPYTHASRGVVLRTDDGGLHWRRVDRGPLPQLRAVRFFDGRRGVAAGAGTAFSPSGIFETDDGGKTWRPIPSAGVWRWTGADFLSSPSGGRVALLAGPRGAAARLVKRRVEPAAGDDDRRGYNAVRLLDASRGWLVGDGGLVRKTRDGGATWREPESSPPDSLSVWCDWRAVDARGDRAWIVGSPGSIVLATDDGGATWRTAETGAATPLCAVRFADDQHGWAVGELGRVIATSNGGQTWRAQRGEQRHTALAFVLGDPADAPAELIASNAAGEGSRAAVAAPLAPDGTVQAGGYAARLTEAVTLLGADATAIGWRLPLEAGDLALAADAIVEGLSDRTDADPRAVLAEDIARFLQTYRPEVVAVPEPTGGPGRLIFDAVVAAIDTASRPPPPELRLAAWTPQRIVAVGPATGVGERFATGDFLPSLGGSPAQHARPARGLLDATHRAAPSAYTSRVVWGEPGVRDRRGDLLAGLHLRRGGPARRPVAMTPAARLGELKRVAQKRRNMERLLERTAGDPAWAGQVMDLTGGLEADAGAELIDQLAHGYRDTGRLDLAAETLFLLAQRYPESPLADAALVWMVRYYASGERAHADSQTAAAAFRAHDDQTAPLANRTATPFVLPPAPDATNKPLTPEDRRERANRLADFLEASRPELYADPGLRLAAAAANRALGYGPDAEKTALLLSKRTIAPDWRGAVLAERWLDKSEGMPPEKPVVSCRRTPRRPLLDGELGDDAWELAEELRLRPVDGSDAGVVRLLCDDEFLFIAAEMPTDADEESSVGPRRRDADLRDFDRLRLKIDIDRDYETAYELTVDRRGWTRDTLWGDRHWRPTWWVASARDSDAWRLEAAVPLRELCAPGELRRAAWAVSVDWLRPNHITVGWTGTPAESGSPDAFGLLLFD